jgi:hypothetical protein
MRIFLTVKKVKIGWKIFRLKERKKMLLFTPVQQLLLLLLLYKNTPTNALSHIVKVLQLKHYNS